VAASNQKFISDAEVVVVALGDSKARARISLASSRIMYLQEPMIAVDHMVLVAVALDTEHAGLAHSMRKR